MFHLTSDSSKMTKNPKVSIEFFNSIQSKPQIQFLIPINLVVGRFCIPKYEYLTYKVGMNNFEKHQPNIETVDKKKTNLLIDNSFRNKKNYFATKYY